MRIVPINEAEAIIEPFWDGGSSEHPKDKYSLLSEYIIDITPGFACAVTQDWYCVEVSIDSAQPEYTAVTMKRECDINVEDYDIFRVFASVPDSVKMTARACIDGQNITLIDNYAGINNTDEIDGAFSGEKMTRLELSFCTVANRPCSVILMWLGLSNHAAQKKMESRKSPFNAEWNAHISANSGKVTPDIGIYFDDDELIRIRSRVKKGNEKRTFDRIREEAVKDMSIIPEDIIGLFVPDPNEYCRRRDMKQKALADSMERLAFVGLVDENMEMSRMSVRMALSIAHCNNWCECIMGAFPGATWHCRSFTEEIYTRACAIVLDWAGYCMTPHGKQVVRDAIIMKGLPRIESDFKRMEYIRGMNQGIAFCTGRIIGLLALVQCYPRYRSLLLEAETDLHEMLDNYIHADSGTLEGISYWNYTIANAARALKALSKYYKVPFKEYLPEKFIKTGNYALGILSTAGDGTTFLNVGDAQMNQKIKPSLAAMFYEISQKDEWKYLYRTTSAGNQYEGDIYQIIFYTDGLEEGETYKLWENKNRFSVMKDIGYTSIVRRANNLGNILFFYCSGPLEQGHCQEDKGSFIIEAAGEVLAMDRGMTANYGNPETKYLKISEYHNLLFPENGNGRVLRQPADKPGGKLDSALYDGEMLFIASNQQNAWEEGAFDVNFRRIISPSPELFIIDDEIEMSEDREMSFIINSLYPVADEGNRFYVTANAAKLHIIPLNWEHEKVLIGVDGVDGSLNPVNRLRLRTKTGKKHRLLTAIEVLPVNATSSLIFGSDNDECLFIRKGDIRVSLNIERIQMTVVKVQDENLKTIQAICNKTDWRVRGGVK